MHALLDIRWSKLSPAERLYIRQGYINDRHHGWSLNDARYFGNGTIDRLITGG